MQNDNSKLKNIGLIIFAATLFMTVVLLKLGLGTSMLWRFSDEGRWLLPLIGISALIDSINPCAFSILILTIAFLFSVGQLRSRILQIGGVYIFGIFLAYILIGLGLLHAFHLFNTPQFMGKLGAFLLIILGSINLINEFNPSFPVKLKIPAAAHHKMAKLMDKGSMLAAFGLGALVGICEFPCTGGPYLMVIGLLHDQGTYLKGLGYLLIYNLIFILPLVVILLISGNERITKRIQIWQGKERGVMRFGGGLAMIVLGVVILLV